MKNSKGIKDALTIDSNEKIMQDLFDDKFKDTHDVLMKQLREYHFKGFKVIRLRAKYIVSWNNELKSLKEIHKNPKDFEIVKDGVTYRPAATKKGVDKGKAYLGFWDYIKDCGWIDISFSQAAKHLRIAGNSELFDVIEQNNDLIPHDINIDNVNHLDKICAEFNKSVKELDKGVERKLSTLPKKERVKKIETEILPLIDSELSSKDSDDGKKNDDGKKDDGEKYVSDKVEFFNGMKKTTLTYNGAKESRQMASVKTANAIIEKYFDISEKRKLVLSLLESDEIAKTKTFQKVLAQFVKSFETAEK